MAACTSLSAINHISLMNEAGNRLITLSTYAQEDFFAFLMTLDDG
jgi:hypothetical protein